MTKGHIAKAVWLLSFPARILSRPVEYAGEKKKGGKR
jgi:hypothetical protein